MEKMKNPNIILKKVAVHNLKEVDLSLPKGKLIVFSGVSGSGKSSLAFDTIYVEGQRRYIESLPHQVGRLVQLEKPKAEKIEGIAPTIAIEQKLAGRTPRSTVGTLTGAYDFLRVLFAKIAIPHCPISGEKVAAQSREKIVVRAQMLPVGTKIVVLSPYARAKKGEFDSDFKELLSKGYTRVRVDGNWLEISDEIKLDGKVAHDVDIIIDRLKIEENSLSRISEALHLALEMGKGVCSLYLPEKEEEITFSESAYSHKSGLSYPPLASHDFSFNHPLGMCPTCQGLGLAATFDLDKIIQPELSISEDCCLIGSSYQTIRYGNIYRNLARIYKFKVDAPWNKLSEEAKKVFLYGTEQKWTKMIFSHPETGQRWHEPVQWRGVIHEANERLASAKSDLYRKKIKAFMKETVCPDCHGAKIKPYPAAAKLGGKTIQELTSLPLSELLSFFKELSLTKEEEEIALELIKEIKERLQFLIYVGLSYLSLDRVSPTLSGGESQRVRLASQIGAGLVGAIYVLDEPSIGLHAIDHHKLIETLFHLRDLGNTVIVVEHDMDTMRAADLIVDVGPGAGQHGGEILCVGTIDDVMKCPKSITGQYLTGTRQIERSKKVRSGENFLKVTGATHHNLQNISVRIPLGTLTCVTGVSGSGKSSLVSDIIYPAISNLFHRSELEVGAHKKIEGLEFLDKIIAVDQSPIGRTPRSNAATYIKLFDDIRELYAKLPESKMRGFTPSHFSFNVKEGSCTYCEGLGVVKIDLDFMEDRQVTCPQCRGQRFDPEILKVTFKEKNIADLLDTDVEEALQIFQDIPTIREKLEMLSHVGLDYLHLGQPSTTLSGGEAQRIKLAKELVRPGTGKTLYIFDEPTTGLHFEDIRRLSLILQRLVDLGNTVLVIEHNIDLIRIADWLVDLGPGAGSFGGTLMGEGTPEQMAKLNTPTGKALRGEISVAKKAPVTKKEDNFITIENGEQNNLKGVSCQIPRGKITVFTGPSGSGKSSLAFDTLYAEGQRRYTETLPSYMRSMIDQAPKPKVDRIQGLLPSIALEQKTGGLNPRSTVGTMTEIYDFLRLFYAHLGTAYCPETKEKIQQISKEWVVQKLLSFTEGEKIIILAPITLEKKETFDELVERLSKLGYLRIRLDGTYYSLDEKIPFDKHKKQALYLVIDRLSIDVKNEKRIYEGIEKASQIAKGIIVIAVGGEEDLFFNLSFAVVKTGKSYPPITPQTFSFNHEAGMCPECQGLGVSYGLKIWAHPKLLKLSLYDLCAHLFGEKEDEKAMKNLTSYFDACHIDLFLPLKDLPLKHQQIVIHGGLEKKIKNSVSLKWVGLDHLFTNIFRMGKKELKEPLLPLMSATTCASCKGARLNPLACHVELEGLTLFSLCSYELEKVLPILKKLDLKKTPFLQEAYLQMTKSLEFLLSIGLGYLTLGRSAPTLSGGELQRIRLAKQLGSGLTSCLYVLDEPTIGLHPYNNELLNQALTSLVDLDNTLVIVEHDPMTIQIADQIFDFGPHAGVHGGKICARGTFSEILKNPDSLTGKYLSGALSIPIPKKRRLFQPDFTVSRANMHYLKNIEIAIAKGAITCLTGVSGSGKSTLMRYLIKPALEKALESRKIPHEIEYEGAKFTGCDLFERVVTIDQSPIGQTSRADVGTYSEIMPHMRAHFASLPLAKAKGLQGKHFSTNHIRGMCRNCWGLGYKTVDLQFLPAVKMPCAVCSGYRLNPISLEVRYKGKHLGEILNFTVQEALEWFADIPKVAKKLQILIEVGLSYLKLGQEIASLSGGEVQRIRLSVELSKRESGKTLYLIDEPTIGLHFEDIARLIPIFHRLADKKNTLLIIEHNMEMIANADYIIDLGPDAGPHGGELIAKGTPEEVAKSKVSKIAPYLRERLKS